MAEERSNFSALAQLLNAIITRRNMDLIEQFGMSVEHIHDPYFKEIYTHIKEHYDRYGEVPTSDTLLSMGGICYDFVTNMYQPETEASDEFIRDKVWEDHIYHEAAKLLQTSADYVNADPKAGIEYLKAAVDHITTQLGTVGTDIVHDPGERLSIYHDKKNNSNWFYPTGFPKLDEKIGGFSPGEDLIVLFARTGVGKEQPLYSRVLTPDGWKQMGDLKLGEHVITATGESAPIIGIFPQGLKDVYRVHFSDGSYVDAGLEHLWKVKEAFSCRRSNTVVSTIDLIKHPRRYKIPVAPSADFKSSVIVKYPYATGCLIGASAGNIGTDSFPDKYIINIREDLSPYGQNIMIRFLIDHKFVKLEEGVLAVSKDSPLYEEMPNILSNRYRFADADEQTRIQLLRGICDVCGTYSSSKNCVVVKCSENVVYNLTTQLISSLGGTYKRARKNTNEIYGYLQENPFSCVFNRMKWIPCDSRRLFKNISYVEKLSDKHYCQCIMVDHPDHTYITDNYTVTHNTWIMTKMLHESWRGGYNVGLIEPEMTEIKIGYRFDTINRGYSNRDLVYGRDLSSGPDDYEKYIQELPNQTQTKFMVAHPKDFGGTVTVSKLKSWCIRNEIKILGVDGISYMKDERGKSSDSTTMSLTNISADLMELSIELGIPVIVVVQSNREGTAQGGKLALENIRDSDGISHSASKVLGLYKKNNALHIQMLKNRDSEFDGTLVYDWDINLGKFQFLQEGEIEGDNPENDGNSRYSYNPQSNTSSRPDRMSSTQSYENVTMGNTSSSEYVF